MKLIEENKSGSDRHRKSKRNTLSYKKLGNFLNPFLYLVRTWMFSKKDFSGFRFPSSVYRSLFIASCFLPLASCLFSGCAYFNTFYNAKQDYKQAVKLRANLPDTTKASASESSLYDKAIDRFARVVKNHPTSRWTDDAVFYLGNCYYYKGEDEKALRKYDEIVIYYPRSKHFYTSLLMTAKVYWRRRDYATALGKLNSLLDRNPPKKIAAEAQFLIGEILVKLEDYSKALKSYQTLLKKYPKSVWRQSAHFHCAELLVSLKDYQSARDELQRLLATKPEKEINFSATLLWGTCEENLGRISEAQKIYKKALRKEREPIRQAKLKWHIASTYLLLGNDEQALKDFEEIIKKYPKTEASGLALLKEAEFYEKNGELSKALEFYNKVREELPSSKVAEEATRKASALATLEQYRKNLIGEASEELAKSQFLLAELYLFQLNAVDSALTTYGQVAQNYPKSYLAPKSCYAIAWIYQHIKKDTLETKVHYEKLIADYPNTKYADAARAFLGLPILPHPLEFEEPEKVTVIAKDTTSAVKDTTKTTSDTTSVKPSFPKEEVPLPGLPREEKESPFDGLR
ncbi:MAG: tetratricopeptide repeat protein [Candidatus Edwardsbacteria bacterium]